MTNGQQDPTPRKTAEHVYDLLLRAASQEMQDNQWTTFSGAAEFGNVYGDGTFLVEVHIVDYTPLVRVGGLIWNTGEYQPLFVNCPTQREAVRTIEMALIAF